MIATLREFYGLQPTPPGDLFQYFVWEILSEHALPARRDLAWQTLKRMPALTPDAMFRTPVSELLDAVGIAGPHREERVEQIRATVGEFKRHREELDAERLRQVSTLQAGRALRRVPHLGPAVLRRAHLFVLREHVLPIDEEVRRVVSRLMGRPNDRRSAIRRWLAQKVHQEGATNRDAVVYLRHHALHTCLKVGPHCHVCPLRKECAHATSLPAEPFERSSIQ